MIVLCVRHAGIEVLVDADNTGNIIVRPSSVEKALRLRSKSSAANHSLKTYRDCECHPPHPLWFLCMYLVKIDVS
jgi:hypothetical protein